MLGFRRTAVNRPDPKQPRMLTGRPHVLVGGGGLAGIAAALVLAERGAQVTVVEPNDVLGGRVSGWTDSYQHQGGGQSFEMERGFHAFFRQYYNLRALLRRIDPDLAHLTRVTDYPLLGPDNLVESFAGLPRVPILNLISLIRRSSTMTLRDALRVDDTLGQAMMAYDPEATYAAYDAMSAAEFLDRLGFPPRARQMLFDVFAHSFFNPEASLSAAELMMMFHFYFIGNPEGIVFDVLDGPFSTRLWQPMRRYLEQLGANILLTETLKKLERTPTGWHVTTDQTTHDVDAVVLAPHVHGLQAIVAASPTLGDPTWRAHVAAQSVTNPFAVWRLWLDRPCAPDRAPFVGTTGLGLLDNISLYHLFEDESRDWAARTGGSVVELHAYALPEDLDDDAVKADMLRALHLLYPETAPAQVLEDRYLRRQDCPAFRPGTAHQRLRVATPEPDLVLAGDFIHTDFPSALMERAAATGILAANQLLQRRGVAEEPLWSVVPRGLFASLVHRRFKRRAR